jgi:uncharacterized membrane protein
MAFCQNCGSPVEGRFCAKCGAAAGSEAGAQSGSSLPPSPGPGAPGISDNIAGALAYIPVLGIIFLLIEPYSRNRTVRFHAFQGLFLLAASIVASIVISTVADVFWGLWFLLRLVRLAFAAIWLFMMFKTFSGDRIVLPVIGPLAEKQA